jgi:hypothetical protein
MDSLIFNPGDEPLTGKAGRKEKTRPGEQNEKRRSEGCSAGLSPALYGSVSAVAAGP